MILKKQNKNKNKKTQQKIKDIINKTKRKMGKSKTITNTNFVNFFYHDFVIEYT